MDQVEPLELIEHLRRGTSRTNVGIWRMPLSKVGHESDIAFRLSINTQVEALDINAYYRSKLDPRTDYARLSASKLFDTLDLIASSQGISDCVFIYNFDLLIARLNEEERRQLWQDLYNRFPNRDRALLLAIPESAVHLLPSDSLLEKWQKESRLI